VSSFVSLRAEPSGRGLRGFGPSFYRASDGFWTGRARRTRRASSRRY